MLTILLIGDVCGRIGRQTVAKLVPKLKLELEADLVIANADNIAHGKGVTVKTANELIAEGVDYLTGGDHAFDQLNSIQDVYSGDLPILRPLNFSRNIPGKGFAEISTKKGKILLISLIGRIYMKYDYECPFTAVDNALKKFEKKNYSAIIVDIHAETASEKIALRHFLDGRVSAIVGSHTHVMTADAMVSKKGTAYLTDLGMTGFDGGVIGLEKEGIIETYLTQIKKPHIMPEKGVSILSGAVVSIDEKKRSAVSIEPVVRRVEID